jgi:hypothetical protein
VNPRYLSDGTIATENGLVKGLTNVKAQDSRLMKDNIRSRIIMKLKTKSYIIALALFTMGAQPAGSQEAPAEPLITWPIFEKGQNLSVRLSYSGGLEGWDAAFGYDGERLMTVNAAFITVTDSEGKKVEPGAGKLVSRWINSREKKPFDTRVNLAEVYDMSKPGRYIVEWGCKKVASQVIRIEIVERNADNEGGQAEQVEEGGADQTTTAPKSKGEKPNPDSEERPAV